MKLLLQNKKNFFPFVLLFIGIIPIFFSIFHSGFFITDDGNWMIIRLSAFYEALRQGQFPVRFLPRLNNELGYPVADFLYPLYLYMGASIHMLHVNFIDTVKILFGFSMIGSALGSFLWFRKLYGNRESMIGALVYTFFPYHVWDITKRGSLGEVLAMAIAPFIFWQIESENIVISGIGIGLLILSHNTLALLFLIVTFSYMVLTKRIKNGMLSTLLGICVSAFFWIPALYDSQYTVFAKTAVSNFSHYFLSNDLYPLIGVVSFVVILFSFMQVFRKNSPSNVIFFLIVTLLSLSLTNRFTLPIWQIFKLGTIVQFPFRFLSITALGVSFLSASMVASWKKTGAIFLGCILLILLYTSSWQFFKANYQYYPDGFYSTNQDTTTVQNEYMPVWVTSFRQQPSLVVANKTIAITPVIDGGSSISFLTNAQIPYDITISRVYFPGWKAFIDSKEASVVPNANGFLSFYIPKGKHSVKVYFTETRIRLVADIISLFTIVMIVALGFLSMIRLKRK